MGKKERKECLTDAELMNFNLGRPVPARLRLHFVSCQHCNQRAWQLESSLCAEIQSAEIGNQKSALFGLLSANGLG